MGDSLRGQCAIVTGAAQGLGLAITRKLLDEGAEVSLWDLEADALEAAVEALGARERIATAVVDVRSEAQIDAARDATLRRFESVSILINNAGISGKHRAAWDLSLADWQNVIDVNMTGVFLCCRAVAPAMMKAGYGRIVNIASVAGKEPSPFISAYATSKAGVIGFTKTLGRELVETGVTVNCVTPAAIRTAIFDQWPEDYVRGLLNKIPMGRFGKPTELADLVAWIASPQASFTTGAVFDLSGGRSDY